MCRDRSEKKVSKLLKNPFFYFENYAFHFVFL